MGTRVQIVAIVAAAGMFVLVFELVRRRRLMERYALLWLFSSAVLLALAAWKGLLVQLAAAVGIYYAPSALFAAAFACILVLLLHFSLVISRVVEQNKVLAQQLGLLRERVEELEGALAHSDAADATAGERARISSLG
ncbi:MAG: DUF2304 domain-containing protein [Actinomycetota bacterium]|nr:DUF2304 domain-containing protein [Actinomycetota bacterium]